MSLKPVVQTLYKQLIRVSKQYDTLPVYKILLTRRNIEHFNHVHSSSSCSSLLSSNERIKQFINEFYHDKSINYYQIQHSLSNIIRHNFKRNSNTTCLLTIQSMVNETFYILRLLTFNKTRINTIFENKHINLYSINSKNNTISLNDPSTIYFDSLTSLPKDWEMTKLHNSPQIRNINNGNTLVKKKGGISSFRLSNNILQSPHIQQFGYKAEDVSITAGMFLIAHPAIEDKTFTNTVLLITSHSNDTGTHGIIINVGLKLSESQRRMKDLTYGVRNLQPGLLFGGIMPSKDGEYVILHRLKHPELIKHSQLIVSHPEYPVYLVNNFTEFNKILQDEKLRCANEAADIVVYSGYCSWNTNQLRKELISGTWVLMNGNGRHIFTQPRGITTKLSTTTTSYDNVSSNDKFSSSLPEALHVASAEPIFPMDSLWSHAIYQIGQEFQEFVKLTTCSQTSHSSSSISEHQTNDQVNHPNPSITSPVNVGNGESSSE